MRMIPVEMEALSVSPSCIGNCYFFFYFNVTTSNTTTTTATSTTSATSITSTTTTTTTSTTKITKHTKSLEEMIADVKKANALLSRMMKKKSIGDKEMKSGMFQASEVLSDILSSV